MCKGVGDEPKKLPRLGDGAKLEEDKGVVCVKGGEVEDDAAEATVTVREKLAELEATLGDISKAKEADTVETPKSWSV